MKKVTVTVKPWNINLSMPEGSNMLKALSAHGVYLDAPCGGRGTCGKCTVKVYPPGEKCPEEESIIQACQTIIKDNIIVEVPGALEEEGCAVKEASCSDTAIASDPVVEFYHLAMTLSGESCLEEVLQHLPPGVSFPEKIRPELLHRMALLTDRQKNFTAVVTDDVLTDFRPRSAAEKPLGIAIDLGTTTVAGALADLQAGITLASTAVHNKQRSCGADVISRADYAMQSTGNLRLIQTRAVETINIIIHKLKEQAGLESEPIDEIVVVGNPVMQHLLIGVSPATLVKAPYTPVFRQALRGAVKPLGIELEPGSSIYIAPSVSAYVGGDTLAAVLATGMYRGEKPRLLIDIGTNGEIVLGYKDRLVACAAAAGPAFEGATLRHGMSSSRGAVNRMEIKDGRITYTVIGNVKPAGICGSGILDAVASMLDEKIISPTGAFNRDKAALSNPLVERIVNGEEGQEFILIPAEETAEGKALSLNRKDIGELQLAKGAIRAGIDILLDHMGLQMEDVEEILLAGAFGNYLRPASAAAVGLWPQFPLERVRPVGNAAGIGARMLLLSRTARKEIERLSLQIEPINLAHTDDFMEKYTHSLSLK